MTVIEADAAIDRSKLLPPRCATISRSSQQTVHGDQPLVFLDNAASTQRPRQVIEVLRRVYERDYANVHRGIHTLSERSTEQYEEAREKVRAFIGAENAREIIFTSGTTAGINLVARSWGDANVKRRRRDPAHHDGAPLQPRALAATGRADRRRAQAHPDHRRRPARSSTRSTRCSPSAPRSSPSPPSRTCWARSTRSPRSSDRAHAAGAVVLVDAAQSVPHLPTNVQALGADFLAFSGHKMLGPTGIGVLYGREELLDAMPPFLGGGSMINRVWADRFTPAELPAKFEAGTPPIAPAIALGAAIDYLNAIGLDAVARHEHELVRYAYERLQEIDGLHDPRPAARAPRRPRELHARRSRTPTTSPSCSTSKASPSAPATTAPGRCTTGSASPPARGPASTSTTRRPKSTCWSKWSRQIRDRFRPQGRQTAQRKRRSAAGFGCQAGGPLH